MTGLRFVIDDIEPTEAKDHDENDRDGENEDGFATELHVRREFVKDKNKAVLNKEKQPHTFDHEESNIKCIGKQFVCKEINEKNAVFNAFKLDIQANFPDEADELMKQCCPF
jgi:hypothetical protein